MSDLVLHLKREYFDAVKCGDKTEEYRLVTPYWEKRLVERRYDNVVLCCGYPKHSDKSKRIIRPWRQPIVRHIVHPEFGIDVSVRVFVLDVSKCEEG